jgi:hypothetical protein
MQKPIWFSCVHIQRLFNEFLSRVYNTSLKISMSKMDSRPSKTITKPYKYSLKIKKGLDKIKVRKKENKYWQGS